MDAANNTNWCDVSTPIRVGVVFAKKPRKRYRRRMASNDSISPELLAKLAKIPGSRIREKRQEKKAREPGGKWSQAGVAAQIDPPTTQQTIGKLEKYKPDAGDKEGVIKESIIKLKVCNLLGLLGNDTAVDSVPMTTQETREGTASLRLFRPRLIEGGSMSITKTTQLRVERPSYIQGNNAWSFEMIGDSMFPEFRDGATLFVDPEIPPEINMGCVFLNADRTLMRVLILVGQTADAWRARQWNPPLEVYLKRKEWPHCEAIEAAHAPHKRGISK